MLLNDIWTDCPARTLSSNFNSGEIVKIYKGIRDQKNSYFL